MQFHVYTFDGWYWPECSHKFMNHRRMFPTNKSKNKVKIPTEFINVLSDEILLQGPFPWTQTLVYWNFSDARGS